MKKLKFQHPTNKVLIFLVVMLIGLLTAVIWDFGQKIDILWRQNIISANFYSSTGATTIDIKVYIQNAEKGLYSDQTVVDPIGERVYIPEARIYLPLTDLSRNLLYNYEAADSTQNTPAQVSINTSFNINRLVNTFADVPCAERMAGFSINKKDGELVGNHFSGSMVLQDGRTLYLFTNVTDSCANYWGPDNPDAIVNLLKQAQSY